jgi:hypothetical protein
MSEIDISAEIKAIDSASLGHAIAAALSLQPFFQAAFHKGELSIRDINTMGDAIAATLADERFYAALKSSAYEAGKQASREISSPYRQNKSVEG